MGEEGEILVVDDDPALQKLCCSIVNQAGYSAQPASDGVEAWEKFSEHRFPVVLTDLDMPRMDGLELLRNIKQSKQGADSNVIIVSGISDTSTMAAVLREEAFDFLSKPFLPDQLKAILDRAAKSRRTKAGCDDPQEIAEGGSSYSYEIEEQHNICIASDHMRDVVELALSFHRAPETPVLIQGESGTGKEKIARLIHEGLRDKSGPFIDLNCAAISPHLLESELFGYAGGRRSSWPVP